MIKIIVIMIYYSNRETLIMKTCLAKIKKRPNWTLTLIFVASLGAA